MILRVIGNNVWGITLAGTSPRPEESRSGQDQPRLPRRVGGWVVKLVTFAASSGGIKGNMRNLFYSLIYLNP